jgi:small GTP-binding protein
MQNLTNLTSLDIRGNSLRTLPDWMQNLTNLTSLDIRSNSLRTLPDWIIQLPNLTSLHADKNSFSSPLREITSEFNSLPGLKEYFRLRKQTVKNKEARLILIGNGEVGKTSVLERLKDNTFREKPSTHGIQHIIWDNFQLPLEHVPEIRLHVWDFAGQEFYHSTHRFFLKTRALFLLVWSADNQEKVLNEPESETEFPLEYWLDKISGLSNHSPIIIVQNKTDAKKMILEKQKEYSEKYNVIDFIDFSAIKDKGSNREKLLELITEVFTNPELMGKEIGWELPLVWHHVKVDLETIAKTRNFISYSEFLELCGKEELNSNSAKILCEFLHNLGTILYLGDYQNQESMVILNQVWSAELAYKFIKNKKFIESEGRFNKEDISKLDDFKSPKEADEFINILTNLELCFKKDYTKEEYIIPTLLPEDKPKHFDLMFRESLHPALLFKFPLYLHRGIMERFIARFGKYADEKTPIWRNGILIVKDDIRVLVEANRKEKVISISFQKDQASGRLLKEIYGSFNNIISDSVQELIPCTCPKCKSNPDGHEFPLAKLTKAYTEKKPLQCEKSLDLVSLSDLIPLDFFVREFADNKNFPDNQESISVLQIQEEKEKKEMERKENKAKRKSSKRKEIRTVLHISSNAADKVKIEHEKEINTIKNVFNSYPEKYTFNSEIDIERKGLSNVLTNNNPYFLQISTHGSTEGLIFKNLEPDQQLVTPKNLLKMVEKKSIQLILFSACHSFEIASALSKTIPYTIGFQGDIDQRITEIFSEAFYCKFIETENILDSFQAGKDALEMNYSPTEDNPEPEKAVKLFKNGEPHEFL